MAIHPTVSVGTALAWQVSCRRARGRWPALGVNDEIILRKYYDLPGIDAFTRNRLRFPVFAEWRREEAARRGGLTWSSKAKSPS